MASIKPLCGRSCVYMAALALLLTTRIEARQAQKQQQVTSPAQLVVTYEPKKGEEAQKLTGDDISVEQSSEKNTSASLHPAAPDASDLQLVILVDDSARASFGTQLADIKQFITSLPPQAEVGLGYMRNGTNQIASPLTRDHAAAAQTVRLPIGNVGADVSPYDSVVDAIHNWTGAWGGKASQERREIVMISSGLERLGGGFTTDNPYVNRSIEEAQKSGTLVYTISYPEGSEFGAGRGFWRNNWAQNFLSQVADETGGEAYNLNLGVPVSLSPFFKELMGQFDHQYLLTFNANAGNKGTLDRVRVRLKEKIGNVASASRVYVKPAL